MLIEVKSDGSKPRITIVFRILTTRAFDPICDDMQKIRSKRKTSNCVNQIRKLGGIGLIALLFALPAKPVEFGDILIVDSSLHALIRLDRTTAERSTLSGSSVGSGTTLQEPTALAVARDGYIIVVDAQRDALFRIDPDTGDRTVLYSGTAFTNPYGLTIDSEGRIYVSDVGKKEILRFNPDGTGRVVFVANVFFLFPRAIAFDSAESFLWVAERYTTQPAASAIYRTPNIYPFSSPNVVSGLGHGSGVVMGYISGICRQSASLFLASDQSNSRIISISQTGLRSVVSDSSRGLGPPLKAPVDITADPSTGRYIVIDRQNSGGCRIIDVDGNSGDRVDISGGFGLTLLDARAAFVYPFYRRLPPLVWNSNLSNLAWPTNGTQNWALESSTDLTSNSWLRITSGISKLDGEYRFIPNTSNSTQEFFRLRRNY